MKTEIKYLDIVLLGDFNPVIFSPSWFSAHDLIGETEAESADVQLIHSDVALFSLPWCRIQVTRERFSIFTEQEAYYTTNLVFTKFGPQILPYRKNRVFALLPRIFKRRNSLRSSKIQRGRVLLSNSA